MQNEAREEKEQPYIAHPPLVKEPQVLMPESEAPVLIEEEHQRESN